MITDERGRQRAVEQYDALGGEPLPDLEAIARIAAAVCGVPNATVNLIDAEHQHQIATEGFEGGVSAREESMCNVTIAEPESVHVSDVRLDPRWSDNPWVTGERGHVVFYASSQLRTSEGHSIGTLCVFDEATHALDADQRRALDDLAGQAVALLELRREALALRRTNAELEMFAGQVAHDLRSPLAAVQGFLQLAAGRFGADLGPRAATCVSSALAGTQRMGDMLGELLRFAAAAGVAHPREVALRTLVLEVLGDLSADREEAAAEIDVEVPADLVVATDPVLFTQVLQNLVSNALRYRDPSRPCRVTIRAAVVEGGWQLQVSDNGVGVPVEERGRIFEVLTRGSNVTAIPGTGIGLATVARLVSALGGAIEVGGEVGAGATFMLHFPLALATDLAQAGSA